MRLVLVITGSLRAAFTPFEINWIRIHRPEIELRVVRTRSARAFVTRPSLQQLCSRGIDDDEWDAERVGPALHVELGQWADAVLVYPATLDYVGRIARGEGDTPSLLMIACSTMPVVIAPALPPGGYEGRTYARHVADIERLPGVAVAQPQPGYSAATRTMSTYTSAELPDCLALLDAMLEAATRLVAGAGGGAGSGAAEVVPLERRP
ncbi:flavoprotein [Nocardioides litoris]|uniref:flavoprotein n=1 Tax=Nocardioides litoris TaxID=1926648 RepID=UPI001476A1BA|nr:flavoprotein [Nocardioides litoris]